MRKKYESKLRPLRMRSNLVRALPGIATGGVCRGAGSTHLGVVSRRGSDGKERLKQKK